MQSNTEINIGKKDVLWSYFSTSLLIGSSVLLFPIILRNLPTEIIGVWSIFLSITALVNMLDFGFDPSFTRNISYIFSGANKLEKKGITDEISSDINYNLLANTIHAMKWFYSRIALIAFLLLITAGSAYIYHIVAKNNIEDVNQIVVAWLLFCFVNTYNIYTLYYDSLILGRGYVKRNKQIAIISQGFYLIVASILVLSGFGLISIVSAQAVSVLIRRYLSYKVFFSRELKEKISKEKTDNYKDIIKVLTPNSVKLGLTSLGAFLVLQSSVIIGSFYLDIDSIASYGITLQLINVVSAFSAVYFSSYVPKIANLRIKNDISSIKKIYYKSILTLFAMFIIGGVIIVLFGRWGLELIKSQTQLLNGGMIAAIMVFIMFEKNHSVAGGFLLTKNEVPFFKASLVAGMITIVLLIVFMSVFNWGLWGMILAPGIANLYNNYKWPYEIVKQLNNKK